MESQSTSFLARQPSGIRALPSHDDDEIDDIYDDFEYNLDYETNNTTIEKVTAIDDNYKNLNYGSNDSNSSISSSFSSGIYGGLVNDEEFENSDIDPHEETLGKIMGSSQNDVSEAGSVMGSSQNDVFGAGSMMGSGPKIGIPVAKLSSEVDDDDIEVSSVEDEEGFEVEKVVPRVRVLGEDEDDEDVEDVEEEWGEPLETRNVGGGEEEKGVELLVVDNGFRSGEKVGGSGVKVVDEWDGDGVVDTLNVDVVEDLRSEVAVVGYDDKRGSEVESVGDVVEKGDVVEMDSNKVVSNVDVLKLGNDVVADKEERIGSKVEVRKTSGVKYSDEGDATVDSINVDASVAVRSGVAGVGEVEEGKRVEVESSVIEDSVAEKYAPEDPKAIDINEAKSVGERETVVDIIKVNVVEVIRSGVPVVGETEFEGTALDTKEVEAPALENVTLGKEFAPLADPNASKAIDDFAVPDDELDQAQNNDNAEMHQFVDNSQTLNTENGKSETDFVSKEFEPAGELKFSGSENEKVQSINVDDEPNTSSMRVEGEKRSNGSYASVLVDGLDITDSDKNQLEQTKVPSPETQVEVQDDEGSSTDGEGDLMYFGNGHSSREVVEELETQNNSGMIDGQVVTDSDEEGDLNEEGEGNEPFDSAASGGQADPSTIPVRYKDGPRRLNMDRPAGLERSLQSAKPTAGSNISSFYSPTNLAPPLEENLSEADKKRLEILQQLKVTFLRLVKRVGFTAKHSLAAQVLYNLNVIAGRPVSPPFTLDNAKQTVMHLEAEGKDNLDFSLNILVLGKTGVGKSAIINSIFGEEKVKINAFEPETTSVNEVCGTVDGVKIRFIDAPGLKSSAMEQGFNRKVLASVKKVTKKYPPDVVFYVDRLDSLTRDLNDRPLLKTVSDSLGSSIWRNAIITLTHASSAPPDEPSGTPLSYDMLVAERSDILQHSIGQAAGEMRLMNLSMRNPVSLIENHPACRKNQDGQKILPNGQAWEPQLLLLCYSVKILSEASAISKSQEAFDSRKLFGFRSRSPPLPYLLSLLLQPHAHPKLSADQGGDSVESDIDLDDVSGSDQEEEDEFDQLPPFNPLKKSQLSKLTKDQKKAYFEEYDYRVKLLQRKQYREELKRMRETKLNEKNGVDSYGEMAEDYDGENGAPAAVPVPLPDMTLPPSFDSDNPAYRYRFLEPNSHFLARPVLDPHGWDHDCGYEGVNVEHNMGIADRFPASFTVQVNKDKKDFTIHLETAVAAKHGENGSSLLGFDVQTIGRQYAYIVRGETKFKNLKKNKTAAGVTVTFLNENVATGVKVEDQIILGKRLVLVGSTGIVQSQRDGVFGANLEARLREADYPIGQEQSSITLSLMKYRGDLAVGANLQSQISVGRNSRVAVRASLNNKMSGQVTLQTSSSDHLSLALAGLMPIAVAIYRKFRPGDIIEDYSI